MTANIRAEKFEFADRQGYSKISNISLISLWISMKLKTMNLSDAKLSENMQKCWLRRAWGIYKIHFVRKIL